MIATADQQTRLLSSWSIWKTYSVGGKVRDQLILEIEEYDKKISDWARGMLMNEDFRTSRKAQSVDFVRVTPPELGFTEMPTTNELYARAKVLCLDLCEAEDGPTIRKLYSEQPDGEVIWVAMKQITVSGGFLRVFKLNRDGDDCWLNSNIVNPNDQWTLDDIKTFHFPGHLNEKLQ